MKLIWIPLLVVGSAAGGSAATYITLKPETLNLIEQRVSREEAEQACYSAMRAHVMDGTGDNGLLAMFAGNLAEGLGPVAENEVQRAFDTGLSYAQIKANCEEKRRELTLRDDDVEGQPAADAGRP